MDTAQEAKELFKSCSARIAEYYKAEKTKKDKALNDFMQEYFPSLEHETEVEQRRKQPGDVASGKRKRQRVQGRTIAQAKKAQEKANQNKKKSTVKESEKANKDEKSEVITQGKSTKQASFGHLITKQARFFILKIFLSPDWSLSDNVSDWFLWRMGPSLGPDGPKAVS